MSKLAAFLAGAGAALLGLEAFRSSRIGFRRLRISLDSQTRWTPSTTRILHLSDLHLTDSTKNKLNQIDFLTDTQWDFVVVSGDLIDNDSGIDPVCEFWGRLKATYGKYAVLGNHDYYHVAAENPVEWCSLFFKSVLGSSRDELCAENDISRLKATLEENGVLLLRNEMAEGDNSVGQRYQVFGIDDPSTGQDKPKKLYSQVKPDALRLVITHAPQRVRNLVPLAPDLVLCGHTHGGQIAVPGFGAVVNPGESDRRQCSGLVNLAGCRVHISPGVSTGRLFPFRLFSRAEVTEIVLETTEKSGANT